jgi:RNA polymerase sigma-70 factor (ECF subfamily)
MTGKRQAAAAELLDRARGGDRDALAELFDRCRPMVESLCAARLGRTDLAGDAVQEVFIKLASSLDRIREPAALPGWLGRTARTTAFDLAEREARRTAIPDPRRLPEQARPGGSLLEAAVRSEDGQRALEAVMKLKPEFREVLLLRYLHSRSYREMAEALGVPVTTVQVRLHRARKELAGIWRD